MKLSIQKMSDFLHRGKDDEAGAVALLCLAAVLALMMIAWVIVDAGDAVEDKIMLQGAADTAALSHAAVEARSMNMIAYANIAKRSIIGIHSLYPGMITAYAMYVVKEIVKCLPKPPFKPPNLAACWRAGWNGVILIRELAVDHVAYSGDPFSPYLNAAQQLAIDAFGRIMKVVNKISKVGKFISLPFGITDISGVTGGGNSHKAYKKDVQALDNYQRYMMHVTPWWAWTEQLSRGWRNGATTVASFPPPPGDITNLLRTVDNVIREVNRYLGMLNIPPVNAPTLSYGYDGLPIKKQHYDFLDWGCHMLLGTSGCGLDMLKNLSLSDIRNMGNESYVAEHILNTALFKKETEKYGVGQITAAGSSIFFVVGLLYSGSVFGKYADPYVVPGGQNPADWLKSTSNLVFAYHNDPSRTGWKRSKFDVPESEISFSNPISGQIYESSGYWAMAKSEISFNGEGWKPDLWHPSWTARMRPVHIKDEFQDYDMFKAYLQVLPYLGLSAQIGSIQGGPGQSLDAVLNSLRDFAVMGGYTASMGPSTVEGLTH